MTAYQFIFSVKSDVSMKNEADPMEVITRSAGSYEKRLFALSFFLFLGKL